VPPRRTLNHSDSMYGALVAGVVVVLVRVEGVKEGGQGGPMTASTGSRHRAPRRLRCKISITSILSQVHVISDNVEGPSFRVLSVKILTVDVNAHQVY